MKKILGFSLLAMALVLASQQQASAWCNFRFGIGANLSAQSGNNTFGWGLARDGQVPGYPTDVIGRGKHGGNNNYGGPGYGGPGFGDPGFGYGAPGFGGPGFGAPVYGGPVGTGAGAGGIVDGGAGVPNPFQGRPPVSPSTTAEPPQAPAGNGAEQIDYRYNYAPAYGYTDGYYYGR